MTDDNPLSEQQLEFCRSYVACQNASMAARKAGYTARSAANQGHRLLRDARVQAEIRRLRQAATRTVLKLVHSSQADADEAVADRARKGLAALPVEIQNAVYAEVREKLDREWIIDRLMQNVRIAMGEVKSSKSVLIQSNPGSAGGAPVSVVQVEVYERNAAAANQALALLLKEVDRMEEESRKKAEENDDPDRPAVKRNPALAEALRRFNERYHKVARENPNLDRPSTKANSASGQ